MYTTKYCRGHLITARRIAIEALRKLRMCLTPGTRVNANGILHHLEPLRYSTLPWSVSRTRTMRGSSISLQGIFHSDICPVRLS